MSVAAAAPRYSKGANAYQPHKYERAGTSISMSMGSSSFSVASGQPSFLQKAAAPYTGKQGGRTSQPYMMLGASRQPSLNLGKFAGAASSTIPSVSAFNPGFGPATANFHVGA